MRILRKVFDFYIKSSIHVAFAVYCLLEITVCSNRLNPINNFSICVFLGTVLGYNFLKYFEIFYSRNFRSKTYFAIFGKVNDKIQFVLSCYQFSYLYLKSSF